MIVQEASHKVEDTPRPAKGSDIDELVMMVLCFLALGCIILRGEAARNSQCRR
jgi:hypothetical protein